MCLLYYSVMLFCKQKTKCRILAIFLVEFSVSMSGFRSSTQHTTGAVSRWFSESTSWACNLVWEAFGTCKMKVLSNMFDTYFVGLLCCVYPLKASSLFWCQGQYQLGSVNCLSSPLAFEIIVTELYFPHLSQNTFWKEKRRVRRQEASSWSVVVIWLLFI